MLFYDDLEDVVFKRNEVILCDELVVISGYVGPKPIHRLGSLPIKTTVIYGMYGAEGIQKSLHQALINEDEEFDNIEIFYSTIPVHSKCYIWFNKGNVVSALVGSANFSVNGLTTPYKEILADATTDTFKHLEKYYKLIMDSAVNCKKAQFKENKKSLKSHTDYVYFDPEVCSMPLYIEVEGVPTVPPQSGINWGMAKLSGSHVNINDAYIRIGSELLEKYPMMFPQKKEAPSDNDTTVVRKDHRHNDSIEILWDDGTIMTGLLEGSIPKVIGGVKANYPKQISTTPKKAELGKYLRKRMNISEGIPITYEDLVKYGRTTVDVSLQGEGVYYFDFSVNKETN